MAITPVPSTVRKVHVYQLCNRTRLESLLVPTAMNAEEVTARLKRDPPAEASFWKPHDDIEVEIMAQHMTEASAEQFLAMYIEHMQQRTWRFRVWRA
jgi:hypothetical protein